tara:strand:- start:1244 stop:1387 length:144 start_codon:yes stop_codon:yes gene_type:complete
MLDAIKKVGKTAFTESSKFHFTEQTPAQVKEALASVSLLLWRAYISV